MSALLIVPKGNDRSWKKEFYRAINKLYRRIWWDAEGDKLVANAVRDMIIHGYGVSVIEWTSK